MGPCHVKYVGATPGADANVYVLFSTVLSELPARGLATTGVERVQLSLLHANGGTLKWYKSQDRGVTWRQIGSETVVAVTSTETFREYEVAALADFKLEWTNGGSAQNPWVVDVALDEQRRALSLLGLPGLLLWTRSDVGISLNAGNVSAWRDLSGKGNHFLQVTAGKQPLFVPSARKGRPALRFDGVDDFMSAAFTLSGLKTVAIVYKLVTRIGTDVIWSGATSSANLATTLAPVQAATESFTMTLPGADIANGVYTQCVVGFTGGGASYLRANSANLVNPGSSGASVALGGICIGALQGVSNFANIDVLEVVVCSGVLQGQDLANLEAYFRAEWDIP